MGDRRRRSGQRGFSLIELLVVVAIIGILSAIAVATYDAYRKRAYEATAMSYMRNWIPAQELYLETYGHYADADEQLAGPFRVLEVPTNIPYNFEINSAGSATARWNGTGTPTRSGLRFFYIDQSGRLTFSMSGPALPPS